MCSSLANSRRYVTFHFFFFFPPLQLWVNIVNGDIHDSTRSDLYEYVVDFLTYSLDQELVWKYADWVLQKSEEVCAS